MNYKNYTHHKNERKLHKYENLHNKKSALIHNRKHKKQKIKTYPQQIKLNTHHKNTYKKLIF